MRYFLVAVANSSVLVDGKEQPCSVEHLQAAIDYWGSGHRVSEPPVITEYDGSRWISVDL
jgi:hypothetical protein